MRMSGPIAVIILLVCMFSMGVEGSRRRQAAQGYRLPDNVLPQKYNLEILTNLEENNFSFEGKVWIKIQCLRPTNKIILHAKDLEIMEKEVTLKQITTPNDTVVIPVNSHNYAKENDFYIVMLGQRLVPGNTYRFYIPFKGMLNEGLAGYYRSSYFDRMVNKTKWLAVTQFESTDARRAFPCFDEPALKATFAISLGHLKHLTAVSNMPLKDTKPIDGKKDWVLDRFEETVPMSTYLVAFVVSEFEFSEAQKSVSNVTFRIWARKEALDQVELAKEVGPKVLSYFAQYFDIDYPLPKQDMIAIPDFNAGAMENWGLITYRETALLYDPKSASIFNKHSISSVISHELAHQWFGNLVTMKWWTDLWLNEGFATYVGALGVHHVFPEWKSLDSTSTSDFLTVLALDELKSSHPVSVPIGHPSQIEQIFDAISYKKGAFLIRMMNMFLGEDVFQKSVANYLKKYKYSNAAQDDLWEALTQTAHERGILQPNVTVKMIMDTWTLQTGYPLLTVVRDYEKNTVTITQNRYLSATAEEKNKNDGQTEQCWWVPLSYTSSKDLQYADVKPKAWLTCDGPLTFTVDINNNEWLLFNLKASGLLRVNYDEKNWILLQNSLINEQEYNKIDTLSRVQLLADSLALAWNGKLEYTMAFSIVSYLQHETEYLPWKTALSLLGNIDQMLLRTSTYGYFKKFVRTLLETTFRKFGSIIDLPADFEGIKFHSLIVSASCHYGTEDCQEQMQSLFRAWFSESNPEENNPIPKDLRGNVYCQALKTGGEKYWEFLWDRYQKSNVATEKSEILASLSCVKELWLLQRYLQWSIDPSKIRKQDSISVFAHVAKNEMGYYLAKDFLMRRFADIRNYHGIKSSRMGKYIQSIASQITNTDELNEFQEFTSTMSAHLKEAELSVKQSIEMASNNIVWHSTHFDSVSRLFIQE